MKKAKKTFDYLLKDFEPNLKYSENWTDLGNGTKSLIRYPFKLTNDLKVKHPFIIYIMFVNIKKYPRLPIFEKVLWEIPILYKGHNFVLAHRKFGFDISSNKETKELSNLALEAMSNIKKAIPHTEAQISDLIKEKVYQGKVTIESQYSKIRNRYIFNREKYSEKNNSDFQKLKTAIDNFKPELYEKVEDFEENYNKIQRLKSMQSYYILSMIDAYFSLLEHVFVLLIPFTKHLKVSEINLEEFIGNNWKQKLQIILKHKTNKESAKFIEILDEIKEQIRNPASHGHFHKKGNSFYVHMDGLGAIPFTLTKSKTNFKFSLFSKASMSFSEICSHFDDFDNYLETYDTKFGMRYIKRDLPVAFDKKSSTTYKRRMITDKSTENYINETVRELENMMNMDW
jgi:hypothetical protein